MRLREIENISKASGKIRQVPRNKQKRIIKYMVVFSK